MTTQTLNPEARRAVERERVDAACKALLTSEGWSRWVRARSVFRSYSFNNQLLIALQAPDATRVAGFQAWRKLGRQVRKGETSIRIYAPMPYRKELKPGEEETGVRFRAVPVFDLAQTDAVAGVEQLPLEPPGQPVTGDSHASLIPRLCDHAAELGYTVRFEPTHGHDGYCSRSKRVIGVNSELAPNGRLRVLVHELCHTHDAGYDTYERAACEVIVDCATHVVCTSVGLDVSADTIPYIAGWAEQDDAISAITRFAGVIDELCKELEAALVRDPAGDSSGSASCRV